MEAILGQSDNPNSSQSNIKIQKKQVVNSKSLGAIVQKVRKQQQLTQLDVALVVNSGNRFLSELENGKPTVQLQKTLDTLQALGIKIYLEWVDEQ